MNWTAPALWPGDTGNGFNSLASFPIAVSPSLAELGGNLYLAITTTTNLSTESYPGTVYLNAFGSDVWIQPGGGAYPANSGPSLAVYNGDLWVAWTTGQNNNPVTASSGDGVNFSLYDNTAMEVGGTPELISYNGGLYIGGRSNYSEDNLWMTGSYGNNEWSSATEYGQTLTQSPGFTVFNGTLYEYEKSNSDTAFWACY